jgi:hypothetical protein
MKPILILLFAANAGHAQLALIVSRPKVTAQKAIVPLAMKNNLAEKVESARAVVFLLDEQGKAVGQPTTRWIIGGSTDKTGLAAGATNVFHFVVTSDKPITTTNLTAKVSVSRVILEGGKLADVTKQVTVTPAK